MSKIILPPHLREKVATPIAPVEAPVADTPTEEKATVLPEPVGYKLLCMVPDVSDKIDGTGLDLVRPSEYQRQEEHATTVLFVLKVGPDAYSDQDKFPSGPWCKPGDFVITRTYSGTRTKIFGKEFRFINDDQVDGVVDDPRGISRA